MRIIIIYVQSSYDKRDILESYNAYSILHSYTTQSKSILNSHNIHYTFHSYTLKADLVLIDIRLAALCAEHTLNTA